MHISPKLAKEITSFTTTDSSRKSIFAVKRNLRTVCESLSTPDIYTTFDVVAASLPRAAVAVVLACTLHVRDWRIENPWPYFVDEVFHAVSLTNFNPDDFHIADDLHPTRICEYARRFILDNSIS